MTKAFCSKLLRRACLVAGVAASAACSSSSSSPATDAGPVKSDAEYKVDVTTGIQSVIGMQLDELYRAVEDLRNAAPVPIGRGWDETQDAQAFVQMKEAWRRARIAYEHVEGAVAPLFPDIDTAIDARYDDFMSALASVGGDADLFDDRGVTGMHAVERILYLKNTPATVVDFEKVLPGHKVAAYPATQEEAAAFKNKLCSKLVTDVKVLVDEWKPAKIDLATAYAGLVALMNEQREKVNKAATGEEESRYSQLTLADIKANLEGTRSVYEVFQPWILAKNDADPAKDGSARDKRIHAGFDALDAAYKVNPGDAMPPPPSTWSSQNPTQADLDTPFGKLFSSVKSAVDANRDGSVVFEMNGVAEVLAFPRLKSGP